MKHGRADAIAETLGVTPAEAGTVLALRGQIKSCMSKTGARSQSQLLLRIQQQSARQTSPQRRR